MSTEIERDPVDQEDDWAAARRKWKAKRDGSKTARKAQLRRLTNAIDGRSLRASGAGGTIIQITGHTDSTGSDAHNLDLSKRRAASVGSYLRSQGVNQMRIITEGFGEQYPIADNATPEGRAQNRRVELRLSPLTA